MGPVPLPDADQFVVASGYLTYQSLFIFVVTNTGTVLLYHLDSNPIGGALTLYPDSQLNGRAFGGAPDSLDAKYVFFDKNCGMYVVNHAGEIWRHHLDLPYYAIVAGTKLNGPGLFGGPNDKYVIAFDNPH